MAHPTRFERMTFAFGGQRLGAQAISRSPRMYARRLSQAAKRNALQRRCEIDPLSGTSCTSVDDDHMSLPLVELDNINQPDDRETQACAPPLIGIAFLGSSQWSIRSAQCCISFVREPKSASGPSQMLNFGRAARQSSSVRSALGWRRAIALASHLLDSVVRDNEIRRDRFNFPMPTKMPTSWTDGANFLPVFSTRLENFPKNMESNQ